MTLHSWFSERSAALVDEGLHLYTMQVRLGHCRGWTAQLPQAWQGEEEMFLSGLHIRSALTQAQQHDPSFDLRAVASPLAAVGDACVADPGVFGGLSGAAAPATPPSAPSEPAPALAAP